MLSQMAQSYPFLWLRNIHVCVCVCVCVYTSFFLSICLLIGCLPILVLVNNATIDIGVHISYLFKLVFLFSLGKYSVVELLDHILFLFLFFKKIYLFI